MFLTPWTHFMRHCFLNWVNIVMSFLSISLESSRCRKYKWIGYSLFISFLPWATWSLEVNWLNCWMEFSNYFLWELRVGEADDHILIRRALLTFLFQRQSFHRVLPIPWPWVKSLCWSFLLSAFVFLFFLFRITYLSVCISRWCAGLWLLQLKLWCLINILLKAI